MKKIFSFIMVFIPVLSISAQTGKVMDNLSMKSQILKMERKYAIYLPPDYETSQRSYPVLYLLHGAGDDQTGWVQFGEVLQIADEAIKSGKATPMIIIMPDANTGKRGYVNDFKNEWRYEDFFFQEFMPFVEKTWRIKGEKRFRAIAGLSMGGEGTFIYALHHPELFSSACPLSAATGPQNIEEMPKYRLWPGIEDIPADRKEDYFKKYSVLSLIENMPDNQKRAVRWYIDCGDDDFLYEGNAIVHISMRKKEIPHEFRIRDGGHTWTYWRTALPVVLEFVSMSFHQF
ncbi:MAG TPA: alpha/beta hydrolase-fold protein [Bacteroidales bacterium]|nr:1,4-beta-xylanase [Bacteroidales bacterium]HRC89474.1 alpha/beta hydrolase-fold protein [Bacteroidales bacterium]